MKTFAQRYKILIYMLNICGANFKIMERLISNKFLLLLSNIWSKMAVLLIPIYMVASIKYLIFDDHSPLLVKLTFCRRLMGYASFFFKTVVFLLKGDEIQKLCEFWDTAINENFYSEENQALLEAAHKGAIWPIWISYMLLFAPAVLYSAQPMFSKSKKLSLPTGFPYREQSPDFEMMVTYDFVRVAVACFISVSFDVILLLLLSRIKAQLEHLQTCLVDMVSILAVDNDGEMVFRNRRAGDKNSIPGKNTDGKPIGQTGSSVQTSKSCWKALKKRMYARTRTGAGTSSSNQETYIHVNGIEKEVMYGQAVDEFHQNFRVWLRQHQQLLAYFDRFKAVFNRAASAQLLYVTGFTCLSAFQFVITRPTITDYLLIPVVSFSNLVTLFYWCRMGDDISFLSSNLFYISFGKDWYLFPSKIRNAFYFVTMRGRKALSLVGGLGLFPVNSFTFFMIVKVTYQLFTFLSQAYRKAEKKGQNI